MQKEVACTVDLSFSRITWRFGKNYNILRGFLESFTTFAPVRDLSLLLLVTSKSVLCPRGRYHLCVSRLTAVQTSLKTYSRRKLSVLLLKDVGKQVRHIEFFFQHQELNFFLNKCPALFLLFKSSWHISKQYTVSCFWNSCEWNIQYSFQYGDLNIH